MIKQLRYQVFSGMHANHQSGYCFDKSAFSLFEDDRLILENFWKNTELPIQAFIYLYNSWDRA